MVLGYGGFLHLSAHKYQTKLRSAKLEDLKKQEVVKIRARIACAWTVTAGIAWAYFTFGGTLIVCGIGGRKWRVADRKLKMIREELVRRGQPLHKIGWRDIAIPVAACALGTALSAGMEVGLASMIHVGDVGITPSGQTIASTGIAPHQEIAALFAYPNHALHGIEQGAVMQPDIVAHTGTTDVANILGIPHGEAPAQTINLDTNAIGQHLASLGGADMTNQNALTQNVAELFGAHLGAEGTGAAERTVGQLAAQELSWWMLESFESPQMSYQASQYLGCARYIGAHNMTCDECERTINRGMYWHCCNCNEDNFDLCTDCYSSGIRCSCKRPKLQQLQLAKAGMLYLPIRRANLERSQTVASLRCKICKGHIFQNRYFTCIECNVHAGGFDICLRCYKKGRSCNGPQTHVLYSLTWATAPQAVYDWPYKDNEACCCDRCGRNVYQGVYYHCQKCKGSNKKKGYFDLCSGCYETKGGCRDNNHTLQRLPAFREIVFESTLESGPVTSSKLVFCNASDCRMFLNEEPLWYECPWCWAKEGKDGAVTFCHTCYSMGAGCFDKQHSIVQHRQSWV